MASHLKEEEIAKIKRQFLDLDEDGSGEITIEELKSILKDPTLKMKEDAISALLAEFDLDGSGGIDISEFLIQMSKKKNKQLRKLIHKAIVLRSPIRKAFNEFDTNGDGFITKKEFKNVMRKQKGRYYCISDAQLDAMIQDYDRNGDGKIDYDEFVYVMTK